MSASEALYTFADMLDYVTASLQGGARTKDRNWIKESIIGIYNEIALAHRWRYYLEEYRIDLNAVQSTGTVTYELTGNAEGDRALTIDGVIGTWPSWVKRGRVKIGTRVYKVKDTTSDANVILLEDNMAPLSDISTATSYQLYQSAYPLPDGFWDMENVAVEESNWIAYYITPTEWHQRERFFGSSGQTWAWTIMRDEDLDNRWSMLVDPIPTTAEPLMFVQRKRPRILRWGGQEGAARTTVSGTNTAGASTVTLATTLPQSMVGSYIRFHSDTSNYPTGIAGQYPYTEQHRIKSISSQTVTLDGTTLGSAYSSAEYVTISDPIDMPETAIEALKAGIEYRLARTAQSGRAIQSAYQIYQSALRTAIENESKVQSQSIVYSRYHYLFRHLDGVITDSV